MKIDKMKNKRGGIKGLVLSGIEPKPIESWINHMLSIKVRTPCLDHYYRAFFSFILSLIAVMAENFDWMYQNKVQLIVIKSFCPDFRP